MPSDLGLGSSTAAYRILRNGEVIDTRDAQSFFDSGLEPGTSYLYTVTTVDAIGNLGKSLVVGLTTAGI